MNTSNNTPIASSDLVTRSSLALAPQRRGLIIRTLLLMSVGICFGVGLHARAATRTWDGGDGTHVEWSTALTWDGDTTAPVSGDILVFSGGIGLLNTNDILGLSLNSIRFDGGGFTLRGNPVALNNGILDNVGFNTNLLNLTLGANQSFSNASPGTALALNGNITNGTRNLTIGGDGDLVIGGIIGSGTGSLTKQGAGVLRLNAANTFSGGVNINAGIVRLGNANAIPNGNGQGNVSIGAAGTLDLTGGSRTINGLNGAGVVDNMNGNATYTLTVGAGNSNGAFSGTIQATTGTAALTKNGTGTQSLDGPNAYSGATVINQGTLKLGAAGSIASTSINISTGAVFDVSALAGGFTLDFGKTLTGGRGTAFGNDIVGSLNSAGTLTILNLGSAGTLTINGGLTLSGGKVRYDLQNVTTAGAGVNDLIAITGPLNIAGPTTIVQGLLSGSFAPGGSYTLVSGATSISGLNNLSMFMPRGLTAAFSAPASSLLVTVSGTPTPGNLIWSGGGSWDVNSSQSWLLNGNPAVYFDFDKVSFDDLAGGGPIDIPDPVTPGSMTVSNEIGGYTFTGPAAIGGSTSLIKHGGARLAFTGPGNTFTGPTVLNGGELFLDFRTQPAVVPLNNILYAGEVTNSLTLGGGSQLTVQSGGGIEHQQHFTGLIVGSNVNRTFGPGRTANDALGVYYGPITRPKAGGVIYLNMVQREPGDPTGEWTSNPLGTIGGYAVFGAAPVTAWAARTATRELNIAGVTQGWIDDYAHTAGESSANAFLTNTHNVNVVAANASTTKTNITINSLRFLEAGQTLTLSGTNTISNGGILAASGSGVTTITGGTLISGNGMDLIVQQHNNAAGQSLNIASVIADNGTATNLTKAGPGLVALSGANTYSGTTYILEGTVQLGSGGTTGGLNNILSIVNRGTLAYRRSDNVTHSTPLSGPGAFATFGTGTLTVTSDLTHQGNTTVGNGATLEIGNGGATGSVSNSPNIPVGNGGTVVFNRSGTVTYSGNVTGAGSLVKRGSGTLNLNGTLGYGGSTTVGGGSLVVGPASILSNTPAIRVDSGATLDVSAAGGLTLNPVIVQTVSGNGTIVGTVTAGSSTTISPGTSAGILTFNNDLVLNGGNIQIEVSAATNDTFRVLGNLTITSGTLEVVALGGPVPNGSYPLFTAASLGGSLGNLAVIGLPPTQDAVINEFSPGVYRLVITSSTASSAIWRGDGAANLWNVNTTPNWRSNGVASVFLNNQFASFDDTGSNNVPVTLVGAIAPKSVTVNAAGNYTFAGAGKISGSSTLDKAGAGTLTILTTNDNFGQASITGGTLQLGNGVRAGNIGSLKLINDASLVFNQPVDQTNVAAIMGSGTVTKLDTNSLTLTGNSTFTNLATFKGTVRVGDGGTVGALAGAVSLVADAVDLGGGTFQTNLASLIFNRAGNVSQGPVTGQGSLANFGAGTLTLTASNSYTGDTILGSGTSAGKIVLGVAGAIPKGPGFGNVVGAAGNDSLDLNGFNTVINGLAGGGGFIGNDGGEGLVTLTIGANGANAGPFSGVIRNTASGGGSLRVVKVGPGSQLLNGNNSFSGGLRIEEGEMNIRGNNNAAGGAANFIELAGGNLRMDNRNLATPINVVSNDAVWILENGAASLNGPLHGPATHTLIISNLNNRPDILAGMNNSTFAGTLKWADDSSAGWRLNGGLGNTTITFDFGQGTGVFEPRNRGLAINYGALKGGPGTVLGGPNSGDQVNAPNIHVIGHKNLDTLFEGTIRDSTTGNGGAPRLVSIAKVGTGTLTLSGPLTYTAGTTVSNGVLALINLSVFPAISDLVNSANGPAGPTNYALTLAAPGVLDVSAMTGGVTPGTVTLGAETELQIIRGDGMIRGSLATLPNSLLTPGFSIGTFTVTNALTLGGQTFMEISTPSSSDQLVANSFTVSPGATLIVTNIGGAIGGGNSFQLFSKPVSGFNAGNMTLPALTAGLTWTNKLAVDGTLAVLGGTTDPTATNLQFQVSAPNTLELVWPAGVGWHLEVQTNAANVGLSTNWLTVPGSDATNRVFRTVDPAQGSVFYRLAFP